MFPLWNHHQATFVYGPDIYDKLISVDHILCKINQQVDFSFVNGACKDLYSQDKGRPVENLPEIMFRSAIVRYMNDYSDRDMEEGNLPKDSMIRVDKIYSLSQTIVAKRLRKIRKMTFESVIAHLNRLMVRMISDIGDSELLNLTGDPAVSNCGFLISSGGDGLWQD